MRVCQIVFEEIEPPVNVYGECNNKYQGQDGVTGSMIYWDSDNQWHYTLVLMVSVQNH